MLAGCITEDCLFVYLNLTNHGTIQILFVLQVLFVLHCICCLAVALFYVLFC